MYQIYQVLPGDTIDSVAKKVGVTVDELKKINGLTSNMVPAYFIVPTNQNNKEYNKYIVKKGDSIYSIARVNNVDYKTLLRINGLKDGEYIYPNQEIIIPATGQNIYVVDENDTIESVSKKLGKSYMELMNKNQQIFLLPDQIINY